MTIFLTVLRWISVIWAGLTGLGLLLSSDLVGDFKITLSDGLEWMSIIVSVSLLGLSSVLELVDDPRDRNARRAHYEVERVMLAMLHDLSVASSIPISELGSSAFVCKGRRWQSSSRPRSLERVVRYRVAQNTPQSGVSWTTEKGVVGDAWRSRRTKHKDLIALAKRYSVRASDSDDGIGRIREETRDGFTPEEFRALVGKYAEIAATPVWHPTKDGALIGVLTIDRALRRSDIDTVASRLNTDGNLAILELNSRLISPKLISPLRPSAE